MESRNSVHVGKLDFDPNFEMNRLSRLDVCVIKWGQLDNYFGFCSQNLPEKIYRSEKSRVDINNLPVFAPQEQNIHQFSPKDSYFASNFSKSDPNFEYFDPIIEHKFA